MDWMTDRDEVRFRMASSNAAKSIVKKARKLKRKGATPDQAIIQAYRDVVPRKFRTGPRRTTAAAQLRFATEILVSKGVLHTPSPAAQRSPAAEDFLDRPEKVVAACGGVRDLEAWPTGR